MISVYLSNACVSKMMEFCQERCVSYADYLPMLLELKRKLEYDIVAESDARGTYTLKQAERKSFRSLALHLR